MCIDLSKWVKNINSELSRGGFENQVDRMIHSVDSSQPLFPDTSVMAQWAPKQSGHGDKDGSYLFRHGLSNMDLCSPRST